MDIRKLQRAIVDGLEDVKAQTLEDQATDLDFEVNLIVLTTDDILEDPINTANADVLRQARVKRSGFDELLSPVSTLLNARWERGVVSVARAHNKFCKDCFRDRADRRLYAGIDGNVLRVIHDTPKGKNIRREDARGG